MQETIKMVIKFLDANDRLSIVSFDHNSYLNMHLTYMSETNKQSASNLITRMETGGSTNISGGLMKAFHELEASKARNAVKSILLLSDGDDDFGF